MRLHIIILVLLAALIPSSAVMGWGVMTMSGGAGGAPASPGIALNLDIQHDQSEGETTTVLPKPTGTVDGDFLLTAISIGSSRTITTLSGWTLITAYNFSTDYRVYVWYKRASSEGTDYTWTASGGAYTEGICWRMTGVVSTGDPQDATLCIATGEGATVTATAITTATANAAVIQIISTSNDYTTLSGTTMTERYDSGVTMGVAADIQPSAESSGNKQGTLGTERTWGTVLLALKPQG